MSTPSKKEINRPVLVGLTGGIGSGKSTIAKIFSCLNVPIFNSDLTAKEIINTDPDVIKSVIDLLGDVYSVGKIQSRKVAQLVFNDKVALEKLNAIIHPKVDEAFNDWVKNHESNEVLIKEAAILIETGAYKKLDQLIVVIADEQTRAKRVMLRDKITKKEVMTKIKNQLSDNEKIPFSNYIIYNNDQDFLIPQVINVLKKIKS